jgi:hypothetical protein
LRVTTTRMFEALYRCGTAPDHVPRKRGALNRTEPTVWILAPRPRPGTPGARRGTHPRGRSDYSLAKEQRNSLESYAGQTPNVRRRPTRPRGSQPAGATRVNPAGRTPRTSLFGRRGRGIISLARGLSIRFSRRFFPTFVRSELALNNAMTTWAATTGVLPKTAAAHQPHLEGLR